MAKDYTDYIALVLEAEKRVYHIHHFRAKTSADLTEIEHNNRQYVFDRDRSFKVKWAPWPKYDKKKPYLYLYELFRTKKVGLLLYHEPLKSEPKYRDVEHKTPKEYICKTCGFTTVHLNGMKVHMRAMHKIKDVGPHIKIAFDVKVEKVPYFDAIQPIHISRMHQPSGELRS